MTQTGSIPSKGIIKKPLTLARWLFIVAALVVLIVTIGGITRLTESGLSITHWSPISGIIPPLTRAQWQNEFAHYREIDQYAAVHAGMTLAQFKGIFFWEYFHRLLGRVIGLAMALPLIWFAWRRAIPPGYGVRLVALLGLIGLQGVFGWLMVRSGLQPGMTEVAPVWLGAHLLTALFTLSALIWTALDLRGLARGESAAQLRPLAAATGVVLAIQLFYGALMAGLRAGYIAGSGWFNWDAWPLIQGKFFPDGVDWSQGVFRAFIHDPFLVHFIHRWWAWVTVAFLVVLARAIRRRARPASVAIHSAFGTQVLLGVATVMSGMALPIAVFHQLVGALLVVATAWGGHALGRRR
jgi:cytochrome c oxidase assembly protein subunit 15